jgi:hypothetical protein
LASTNDSMNDDDDRRERILRLEAEIQKLAGAIELGRKVIPVAQAAVVAAGILIMAITIGAIGFDPIAVIGGSIPLIGGILFLAWRRRRLTLMASLLQIAKANSATLIDTIDPSKLKK